MFLKKDIVFGKLDQAVFYSKSVSKQTDDLANLCLATRPESNAALLSEKLIAPFTGLCPSATRTSSSTVTTGGARVV